MIDSAFTTTIFVIAASIAAVVVITYVPAAWLKRKQVRRLSRLCVGKLALTYDDGPDPLLTPRLLEMLQRYNAKASFFFLGFRAQRSPHMCDLVVKHGHDVGCHAQHHLHNWRVWPWRAISNINRGYAAMSRWLAADAPFRPPFGKLTTWAWLVLHNRRAPVRWWTHDGGDTFATLPDPDDVVRQVVASNGGVVLLHFHDRGPEREQFVLDVTERLLVAAREHGLHVCTMQALYADAHGNQISGADSPQLRSPAFHKNNESRVHQPQHTLHTVP